MEQEHFPSSRITYLLPGQSTVLSSGGRAVEIKATSGATLGPPWQQAENGFVVRPAAAEGSEKGARSVLVLERDLCEGFWCPRPCCISVHIYVHTPFRRFAQILFLFFLSFLFFVFELCISTRKSLSIIYRVRCTHAHTSVASRLVLNKECSRKVHRCDALPSCRYSIFCMCAAAAAAAASCCTFQAPLCVCELHIYMLTRACSICTTALLFSFYELRLLPGKLVRSFEGRGFST